MSRTRPLPVALLALISLSSCQEATSLYDLDEDGSLDADDCAPSDPLIHPAADDPYGDGIDQNCDGTDGDASDLDNDGAPNETDCGPDDSTIHPGADDPYGDGIDQDCDGGDGIDLDGDGYPSNLEIGDPLLDCNDSDAALSPADQDADGYSTCAGDCNDLDASVTPNDGDLDGYSTCDGDCDDSNDLISPDQVEVCDLIDNDCDSSSGEVGDGVDGDGDGDAACADCDDSDGTAETLDRDGDGISTCGPDGLPDTSDDDCDDNNNSFYPGAPDVYGDVADHNCDGTDGIDSDGDGVAVLGGDCNDSDPTEYPGAPEICNGELENCTGTLPADEIDGDGDGYVECVGWVGTDPLVVGDGDCRPTDAGTYPGAPEPCSGIDNDCNGTVDGNFDLDGDGYSPCAGDCDDDDVNSEIAGLLTTAQGIGFRSICAGSFEMGCTAGQSSCASQESPVHTVTLTHTFELGETEVTQSQWQALMGTNPSYFSSTGAGADCGWDCPVETVNWWASLAFANALSSAEGLAECYDLTVTNSVTVTSATGSVYDCEGYRLPTEAEWEHAARAGADLLYAGSNTLDDVAWHEDNGGWTTHPVGTMVPNAWSLYDMSGNVWEWTWDWYDSAYYSSINIWTNPEGSAGGSIRVRRGGSWRASAYKARVANRSGKSPGHQDWSLGLRPARTLP